jgi:hypothetical protein
VTWLETPLDAEFSAIRQRRADAGLGWLSPAGDAVPALEVMSLGDFEPVAWIPRAHPAAPAGVIGPEELARMDIVHGPRRISAGIYDAWLKILRAGHPRLEFIDPPFRNSLPMALAFAATGSRPTAALTGPRRQIGAGSGPAQPDQVADSYGMVPVGIPDHPLTATAGLIWNGDLFRSLQQVLVDTAMEESFDQQQPGNFL